MSRTVGSSQPGTGRSSAAPAPSRTRRRAFSASTSTARATPTASAACASSSYATYPSGRDCLFEKSPGRFKASLLEKVPQGIGDPFLRSKVNEGIGGMQKKDRADVARTDWRHLDKAEFFQDLYSLAPRPHGSI